MNQFARTELLYGKDAIEKLKNSKVAIFGLGGVGSYATEALARIGIGELDLIDCDIVSLTNLNRQLIALYSTLDKAKVDVAKQRILDINPSAKVNTFQIFFSNETSSYFDFSKYDYVIDAIDSIKSKIEIIKIAKEKNIKMISSMGTGNKTNPFLFEIADISKTSVCPLARKMRIELKKLKIDKVKVLYSKESPVKTNQNNNDKLIPASNSFIPPIAGLMIASEVVKDLIS